MKSPGIIRLFDSPDQAAPATTAAPAHSVPPTAPESPIPLPAPEKVVKPNGGIADGPGLQLATHHSHERHDAATRVVPLERSGSPTLLCSGTMQHYAAEQYRIIRTAIVRALQRPFVLAISSPGVADGKTLTAANLAAALAMCGEGSTLLIDADLRGASVHKRFRIDQSPGLAEILSGAARLQSALIRFDSLPALHVLPGGETNANPTDLFDSAAWHELVADVRARFAHVVLDCPPVGLFADFDLISGVSDGVLAVIRPGHTNRTLCTDALAKLRPKLTGVVINGTEDWLLWNRSTRKYYSHYAAKAGQPGAGRLGPAQ